MDAIELMSTLAGTLAYRPKIREQQREVAKVMIADSRNAKENPSAFIKLDFESTDPEIVRIIRQIPYEARQELKAHFGKNPVLVRSSIINPLFGFKVYSMVSIFDKLDNNRKLNFAEELLVRMLLPVAKSQSRAVVLQTERLVQNFMTTIKDMIVVRSGGVLLGNIISNIQLLLLSGVNPVDVISKSIFAWRNGRTYSKVQNRLHAIDTEMSITKNRSTLAQLKQERHTLTSQLERNPMHAYMQAGLQSTIVEDLNQDDSVLYKSKVEKKIEEFTNKIPTPFKTMFNTVTIGEGTQLHSFLSEATQFSDFAAKYVLADHIANKATKKGMDKSKAFDMGVWEAQKAFINYDVPTSVGLDYLNRMGLTLFTKFFLRFQSRLIKLFKEKPAQTLAMHYMFETLGQQGIIEPFFLNRLGNPFDGSVLLADDALGEILTINLLL